MATLFRIVGGPLLAFVNYILVPRASHALFDMPEDEDDLDASVGRPDR
ncbi:hypothetical protein Rhow_001125 [Rhodococcus wratislaviensis]|uniref:Uncharacterized protein n=1 Tax=Rhodococcus wratislaviensis TaxID=44752 RepID=A0A402CNG2_RHOWR|nr:hypothetical protein Rhow_001125 [Rhodococcus wratislaviensis]